MIVLVKIIFGISVLTVVDIVLEVLFNYDVVTVRKRVEDHRSNLEIIKDHEKVI